MSVPSTVLDRMAELVAGERAADADPGDPFRGLYVGDHHVDRLLASDISLGIADGAIEQLAQRAALTGLDVDLLVAAVAPDLDPAVERLYVYLNDDITRRRATAGLALRMAGAEPTDPAARARVLAGAPLVDLHLVEIDDADRPFLSRSLRVPDRVLQHLLGDEALPADIAALEVAAAAWPTSDDVEQLARAFSHGRGFVHLHDPGELGGVDLAHSTLRHLDREVLGIDVGRARLDGLDPATIVREAVIRDAGLVVANADRAQPDLLRGLVDTAPAIVVVSRDPWDPGLSARSPVQRRVEAPTLLARRDTWRAALPDIDPAPLDTLRLSPGAIRRSVAAAHELAAVEGRPLDVTHVRDAARLQASSRLERLARRIRPGVSWDGLVVRDETRADLELLATRVRHREKVLDSWGLRRRSGHAEGIAALFAGDSGTGKTLAAEVLASDLGLDLYVVDLSTVVDKYIGETEKNLERIFTEAEGVNGVLFFDEADALFGKRSEVSDARDRYANTEIAYLLQRIEQFDGFAVLATNLRANIDEAFLRRLAAVVDFPDPDAGLRRHLWALHLRTVPHTGHVDLDFLAEAFAFSGGNIRNVAVTAAYMAAADDRHVEMTDLVRGVALEYRKLGRLRDESEFGPWMEVA
jgi:AAA+ superfamily predicted ATPase